MASPNNNEQWNGSAFGLHRNYTAFDHYQLLNETANTPAPANMLARVRLCDYAAAITALNARRSHLNGLADGDFDRKGMLRSTRCPLGHAAKQWFGPGAIDRDGHVVTAGEAGWYYVLYKGIHPMVGKEGYDQGRYFMHGSREWEFTAYLHSSAFQPLGLLYNYRRGIQMIPLGSESPRIG